MLLAIDIGNTNITVGLFEKSGAKFKQGPIKTWRLTTAAASTADEYGIKILNLLSFSKIASSVSAIAIASVVPSLDFEFKEMSRKYFKCEPLFVSSANKLPLKLAFDNPKEIGADRIADAVAAKALFGTPIIIIDFGTATTFDCVNKKGEYIGGVITPGPRLSAESLSKRTAKLPLIDIKRPLQVIGKNTIACIQSGIYYGYIGLVKEILREIKKGLPGKPKIIATGGLAHLIVSEMAEVRHIENDLTLEGIRLIYEYSK